MAIVDYLRTQFRAYLQETGESIRAIAVNSGIDYQKLYRLNNGELKNLGYFDARVVLDIIKPEDAQKKLLEFFPAETKELNAALSAAAIEAIRAVSKSPMATEIHIFVAERDEVYSEDIAREYGNRGLQVIEELERKGAIVRSESGQIRDGLEGLATAPGDVLADLYQNYGDIVDQQEPGHLLRLYSKGLNDEGLRKVYGIIAEASLAITETIRDPQYRGSKIYLATLLCGQLTDRAKEAKV
jgi:hypothetical protein